MIPLALIAVFVLAGAFLLVGFVETGDEPDENIDTSVAIDRTESLTQTAVRDGVQDAAETAASRPLTEVNATNTFGEILMRQPGSAFENYLKILIHQKISEKLGAVGQEVGDVKTTLTVPDITDTEDFENATERISIDKKPEGETGMIDVTVGDITLTATHRGEIVHQEEKTVHASVATPIFQLHDRVTEYEEALNAGITSRGFTQRFNARMYGIGYLRGWAQNAQAPVVEVIANRHIEPSANSAVYRTQKDVFGTADPALQGAVQAGWACMFMQDGEAFMGNSEFSPDIGGEYLEGFDVGGDELCNVTEYMLDPEQDLEIDPADFVEQIPGMEGKEEIEVGSKAYLPLAHMADPSHEDSLLSVLERMFTVQGAIETDVTPNEEDPFDHDCSPEDIQREQDGNSYAISVSEESSRLDASDGTIYELSATISTGVREYCDENDVFYWQKHEDTETLEWDVTSVLSVEETNPGVKVDDAYPDVDTRYEFRTGSPENIDRESVVSYEPQHNNEFQNYGGQVTNGIAKNLLLYDKLEGSSLFELQSATECFGIENLKRLYRCWLQNQIGGKNATVTSKGDISVARSSTEVPVDPTDYLADVDELTGTLFEDIKQIQEEMQKINASFERAALLETGKDNPFTELISEVQATKREYTDVSKLAGPDEYANIGEKVVLETRYTYFEHLETQLGVFERLHSDAIERLEEEFDGVVDDIDEALEFLQQGPNDPNPTDDDFDSPTVTETITFEVSGSPTYLESENITKADVPAVDANEKFSPLSMRNRDQIDLPYDDVIDSLFEQLQDILSFSDPDAELTFRMAGDVLIAAEQAQKAADPDRVNTSDFDDSVAELERNLNDGLETVGEDAAIRITQQLYDEETAYCVIHAPSNWREHILDAGKETVRATKAGFDEITDPHNWKSWGEDALVSAVETARDTKDYFDPREGGWFDSGDEDTEGDIEAFGEEFDDAENIEDAPFDPTHDEYRYGDCAGSLDDVSKEYQNTIEEANEEIETAIQDEIEVSLERHGTARTAEKVGNGELSGEIAHSIQNAIGDGAYIPDEWPDSYELADWESIVESAVVPGMEYGAGLTVDIGNVDDVENIDEGIQEALGDVATDLVQERLDLDVDGDALTEFAEDELEEMEEWVGNWQGQHSRAARVPAGMPLLPMPGFWYATVNGWNIDVGGEYARFEVTANMGTPDSTTATTYVREDQPLELEINGSAEQIGTVDSIDFDGRSILLIVVPPGVGVGDRDNENPECSPTYPATGYVTGEEIGC